MRSPLTDAMHAMNAGKTKQVGGFWCPCHASLIYSVLYPDEVGKSRINLFLWGQGGGTRVFLCRVVLGNTYGRDAMNAGKAVGALATGHVYLRQQRHLADAGSAPPFAVA